MKKLLALLCLLVFISFVGCDNSSQTSSPYSNSPSQYTTREETPKEVTVYIRDIIKSCGWIKMSVS